MARSPALILLSISSEAANCSSTSRLAGLAVILSLSVTSSTLDATSVGVDIAWFWDKAKRMRVLPLGRTLSVA